MSTSACYSSPGVIGSIFSHSFILQVTQKNWYIKATTESTSWIRCKRISGYHTKSVHESDDMLGHMVAFATLLLGESNKAVISHQRNLYCSYRNCSNRLIVINEGLLGIRGLFLSIIWKSQTMATSKLKMHTQLTLPTYTKKKKIMPAHYHSSSQTQLLACTQIMGFPWIILTLALQHIKYRPAWHNDRSTGECQTRCAE